MIPKIYHLDINGTQNVINGVCEIIFVAQSGGGVFSYLGLVDDLIKIVANMKEAKGEVQDLNPLEVEELLKANISEILKKFDVLKGTSKYGIENIIEAVKNATEILKIVKLALENGIDLEDTKHLPEIFDLLLQIYLRREVISLEFKDIQATEAEDILVYLHAKIIDILQ